MKLTRSISKTLKAPAARALCDKLLEENTPFELTITRVDKGVFRICLLCANEDAAHFLRIIIRCCYDTNKK